MQDLGSGARSRRNVQNQNAGDRCMSWVKEQKAEGRFRSKEQDIGAGDTLLLTHLQKPPLHQVLLEGRQE